MVKIRVQELSQSTFLKDVSNEIMVLEEPGRALITPASPPPSGVPLGGEDQEG